MKKILIAFIFLLTSCGYQSLYSNKDSRLFSFKEIETIGNKDINRNLISSSFLKEDSQKFFYEKLILENSKTINETSKNSKGQPEFYQMTISLQVTIIDKKKIIKKKTFSEEFFYKNQDNKFDLNQYENNIQNNLVNKIVQDLNIYLNL